MQRLDVSFSAGALRQHAEEIRSTFHTRLGVFIGALDSGWRLGLTTILGAMPDYTIQQRREMVLQQSKFLNQYS